MDIISLILLATVFEIVDSGLGMMYGTLLSPFLLVLGYPATEVVPSILISQAVGGSFGSFFHNQEGTSDFSSLKKDLGLALIVVVTGAWASLLGVAFASYIPDKGIKLYIGAIAILMGGLCLVKLSYNFSRTKVAIIGTLASFNKSSTGGGFGPLCSTGLIVGGVKSSTSIAITTMAEVPLCIMSFMTYYVLKNKLPDSKLMLCLIAGSAVGGTLGPKITSRINPEVLKKIVGALAIISGVIVVLKAL